MAVPTGTATPWFEVESCEEDDSFVTFIRDGHVSGSADMLAEALRMSGVIRSLGPAIRSAEEAVLDFGYYGYVDGDERYPALCDSELLTVSGETVDQPRPCVVARVSVDV